MVTLPRTCHVRVDVHVKRFLSNCRRRPSKHVDLIDLDLGATGRCTVDRSIFADL